MILPFAEYHRTMFWPYGRVIKNLSGYHGECLIQNKPTLMNLGSTLYQAYCSMDIIVRIVLSTKRSIWVSSSSNNILITEKKHQKQTLYIGKNDAFSCY